MNARETIIELLTEHGELTGRELVQRSNGRLGAGTVYVWLAQLEDEGHVTRRQLPPPQNGLLPYSAFRLAPRGAREPLPDIPGCPA